MAQQQSTSESNDRHRAGEGKYPLPLAVFLDTGEHCESEKQSKAC